MLFTFAYCSKRYCFREDTTALKEGEENKIKAYSALCWADKEVDQSKLSELSEIKVTNLFLSMYIYICDLVS